jgi:hypothetical protein
MLIRFGHTALDVVVMRAAYLRCRCREIRRYRR